MDIAAALWSLWSNLLATNIYTFDMIRNIPVFTDSSEASMPDEHRKWAGPQFADDTNKSKDATTSGELVDLPESRLDKSEIHHDSH
jgi:hypothetical protein